MDGAVGQDRVALGRCQMRTHSRYRPGIIALPVAYSESHRPIEAFGEVEVTI